MLSISGLGATPILQPFGVALDLAGNLYIADSGNGRIVKVTTGGVGFRTVDSDGQRQRLRDDWPRQSGLPVAGSGFSWCAKIFA